MNPMRDFSVGFFCHPPPRRVFPSGFSATPLLLIPIISQLPLFRTILNN